MASFQLDNPAVPFWDDIPGGITVGKIIKIRGIFPSTTDPSRYTSINLCEHTPDLIALHLSIRFNHRTVVRNTYQRHNWETEEKDGPFPFAPGKQFMIQILVEQHGYMISVDGLHCWTFAHRLSYARLTHLNIDGPLTIWSVAYSHKNNQRAESSRPVTPPANRIVTNPQLPLFRNLPQSPTVGTLIKIKGFFPASIDMSSYTQINLCQNSSSVIAFHLSIRFNNRIVVRNSKRHGAWEIEERGGPFPFMLGREFLIQILVRPDAYQISVNGSHCWMFVHRLPFGMVNHLTIDGPVNIWHVDYVNNQAQKQQQKQNLRLTPEPPPALEPVYNPPVPFSYHIPGGIKNGMMVYISGVPTANFQRFTINLQCGRKQNADIAFHFDARGYNATVVRNTRRHNNWEDEETAASFFPFFKSVPFDMIILILNDKYMVAVNGSHFTEYYHRMTRFALIDTLRIECDVRISSVRFDTTPK